MFSLQVNGPTQPRSTREIWRTFAQCYKNKSPGVQEAYAAALKKTHCMITGGSKEQGDCERRCVGVTGPWNQN